MDSDRDSEEGLVHHISGEGTILFGSEEALNSMRHTANFNNMA